MSNRYSDFRGRSAQIVAPNALLGTRPIERFQRVQISLMLSSGNVFILSSFSTGARRWALTHSSDGLITFQSRSFDRAFPARLAIASLHERNFGFEFAMVYIV
jgi:hypothetical protein